MTCSIPVEQLRKFRIKLLKNIETILDSGTPFDLKEFLSNIYGEILEKTGDEALSLDYIMVAPLLIDQIKVSDTVLDRLIEQKFDFSDLMLQMSKFNKEDGIETAISYLGLENNLVEELRPLQNVVPEETPVEKDMPEGDENVYGPMDNIDINGNPIVTQERGVFRAYALNFLSDNEWETLSIKPGEPGYNVVDPQKTFYYGVKRAILKALKGFDDSSEMNFKGQGPVYLKAVEVSTLDARDKRSLTSTDKLSLEELDKTIAMVVVDQNGQPLRFDPATGELSPEGVVSYYTMKNTEKFIQNGVVTLNDTESKRAEVISKNLGIPLQEAQNFIKEQIKFTDRLREYIKRDPKNNSLTLKITGGSQGFPNYDWRVKTKLTEISDKFTIHVEKFGDKGIGKGFFFIEVDSIEGMPIRIDAPYLKDTPYVDTLITLFTEDVYDEYGNKYDLDAKRAFIDMYTITSLKKDNERLGLLEDAVLISGKKYKVQTDTEKVIAKEALRKHFTELTPTRIIKDADVGDRVKLKPGDPYMLNAVTQDDQGRYWIIEYMYMNGFDRIGTIFNDITAITNTDGKFIIQTQKKEFNQFVKENWTTKYVLNDEKQIVKVQAYLTFDLTNQSMDKLDGTAKEIETNPEMTAIQAYEQMSMIAFQKNGVPSFNMQRILLDTYKAGKITKQNAIEILNVWQERKSYNGEISLSNGQLEAIQKQLGIIEKAPFVKPVVEDPWTETANEVKKEEVEPINQDTVPFTGNVDLDILGLIDDNANDPTLNKNFDQKNVDVKATKEQITAAKKWYESHPLSKVFPFEAMFNLINTSNPNAVATWAMHGIRLYKGSDFTDLYHEAFHGFSQAFLTKDQKKALYADVRKLKGTFTDHNGKTQQFATASDLQAEEYLAEGFRKYMLSDRKKTTPSKKVNSFFDILFNILDALFGNLTFNEVFSDQNSNDKINELYEKLRVGNLTEYSFNESNASFGNLNAGIRSYDSGEVVKELSYEDSADVLEIIDSLFSDFVDMNNTLAPLTKEERVEFMTLQSQIGTGLLEGEALAAAKTKLTAYLQNPNKTNKFTSSLINTVNGRLSSFKYVYSQLNSLGKALTLKHNAETNPAKQAHLAKKIHTLAWAVRNFGNLESLAKNMPDENGAINGVIGYYQVKSKRFLEDISEQIYGAEANTEEQIMLKGREVNSISNEHSSQDLAKKEILYLLKSLHELDDSKKAIYNDYGVKKLVDFSEVWNKVAVTLENTTDPSVMYSKLKALSSSYPSIEQLLSKIGNPDKANISDTEQSLWSAFTSAFNLTRAPLIQMTIERTTNPTGVVTYTSKIGAAFGSHAAVGRTWESEFQRTESNPFIKSDDEGNYLDIQAVITKYPTKESIANKEIKFLNDIGILISDKEVIAQILQEGDKSLGIRGGLAEKIYMSVSDVARFQREAMVTPIVIRSINDYIKKYEDFGKTSNERGNLKTLQEIELQFGDERSNFMVQNAEGNTQFEHTLNNTLSLMVNAINAADDYDSLVALPYMSHLDINRNPNAKYSSMLNSIFKMDVTGSEFGKRRRISSETNSPFVKINFANLSGAAIFDQEGNSDTGIAAARADEFSKLIIDFHMANNPNGFMAEMMRHSDKSTSFTTYLTKIFTKGTGKAAQTSYIEIDEFINSTSYQRTGYEILKNYVFAEHSRIKQLQKVAEAAAKDPSYIYDYGYLKRGQEFNVFHDIFDKKLKADLIAIDDLEAFMNSSEGLPISLRIKSAIDTYFENQATSVESKFKSAEFISGSLRSSMQNKMGSAYTEGAARTALVKSLVYNNWIHNIETVNMFYGDLAMYNHNKQEFHKRNAGIGSTGTVFRTDDSMLTYINNRVKRGYGDKLGIPYDAYDGRLKTAVIEDVNSRSLFYDEIAAEQKKAYVSQFMNANPELSQADAEARADQKLYGKGTHAEPGKDGIMNAYANMNEADAQGYLSFDAYRLLSISQGEWNFKTQEVMYQDIINGKDFDQTLISELFPPAKYQYWGPVETGQSELPLMAFHKYSLAPLIPGNYKEGSNIDKLHKKMMTEKIDYVVFESGSKVGTITSGKEKDQWYNHNTRSVNENIKFTPNVIYANFLKNQLKIHTHFKGNVTFPTQLRKLIEDGLMEYGVPTDFQTGLDVDTRILNWNNLSLEEKMKSPHYNLVKNYERDIAALTEVKKQKLLQEAGLKEENGEIVGNSDKLWNFVKNELTRQDLADHEIDFIQVVNGQLRYDLSLSLSADKIEKLLNAIVTRRLVKQKFHGEGLYQLSSAMFEDVESTQRFTKPTQEDLDKWGTNDLPTYRIRNGKTQAAKVKIALQGDFEYLFYIKGLDGKQIAVKNEEGALDYNASLAKLNALLKDDKWLDKDDNRSMITMTGVRIPTQGLNSMEFMEVYEFLPKTASNVIILPAEIVAKSGADFDIDKLTVLMPNISKAYKTNVTNENLRKLQKEYPELDFSRDNVEIIKDAVKNDEEVYTLTAEDKQVLKAIEQYTTIEISYKTNNSEKGLENRLINDIKNILELPENYASLTRPNGVDILDPIQKELSDKVNEYDPSFTYQDESGVAKGQISPTRVLEVEYNLYKHYTNNIGKQTLGLGAVDNTFNTLLTRVNAYMNPTANGMPQTIYFPHNTINVNGQKAISLAALMDANGENRISDIINQMINGWVDIAKDAWIFNVQGNKEITPVLLFLVQAGVPIKDAVYFVSLPSVRKYVSEQKKFKSTFSETLGYGNERSFAKTNAAKSVLDSLGFQFDERDTVSDVVNGEFALMSSEMEFNGNFDSAEIEKIVSDKTAKTTNYERLAFLHFLQIEDMAKAVRDVKLRMNLDTAESKSLFEASDRIELIKELEADGRIGTGLVENLLKESPIGSFAIQDFQLKIWKDAFKLRNHPVFNAFISDFKNLSAVNATLGDNEKFVNGMKNDLLSYIIQNSFNTASLNNSLTSYRGYNVAEGRETTADIAENAKEFKFGAFMVDGVLYIDKNKIVSDYNTSAYTSEAYGELGLAKVPELAFSTLDEYVKFVLEREYLRGTSMSFAKVSSSKEFASKMKLAKEKEYWPQRQGETLERYKYRLNRNVYEMMLRDNALDNSFNGWKLFQSNDTYANQFAKIKNDYPEVVANFPLLKYFVIGKNDKGYTNIKLIDTQLDANTINRIHQMFIKLTNPEELGISDAKDAQAVANFFRKFPVVGFLQSGLNTRGQFAMGRFLPQDILLGLMEKPVKEFIAEMNRYLDKNGKAVGAPKILDDYAKLWMRENSYRNFSTMSRHKNYKSDFKTPDLVIEQEDDVNIYPSVKELVSIENLQKSPIFEGIVIDFVEEIKTDKDKPVPLRKVFGEEKVLMATNLMFKKYEEKAWTISSTQNDGSKSTPLPENAFGSFNEFLTFGLLHEKAHTYIFKEKGEETGAYETRINNEAMRRLEPLLGKESLGDNAKAQVPVTVTDEMIQDFMFNVCK